ncbi:MAG TPA: hypothetical protein VFL36_13385 [Myxococcales bacterium]|nr:hypothetical protein [Myxococcales bacterium]
MTRIIVAAMLGSLFGVAVSAAARQPVPVDGRCIPCGPNKACENPLTVCVPQTPSGNGCCLGLAN